MGLKAESNRVRVAYVREEFFGVPESNPTYQIARLTSSDLAANKQTVTSEELRSDRMVSDQPEVGFDNGGTLNVEYSSETYEDFVESALCGTYSYDTINDLLKAPINLTDIATATTVTTNTIAAVGIDTNAIVGQWVYLNMDFTDSTNNGWKKVATVGSGEITVEQDLTTDTATNGTIDGKDLINGVEQRSYEVEQAFTDILEYFQFSGMRLGTWDVSVSAGEILNGSFSFQGTSVAAQSDDEYGTAYTSASTTPVMNATSNVGSIMKDGVALTTCIQSLNFTIDNNLRSQMCIGNKFPSGIGYGRQLITGTLNAYFENLDLYNEMLTHDDVSLEFQITDINGRSMKFEFPRVKFNSSAPSPEGIDTDVMENIEWTAIADTSGTYQIRIGMSQSGN